MMKKIGLIALLALTVLATGCSGQKINSEIQDAVVYDPGYEIQIIQDKETRTGFLDAVTAWMDQNGYQYTVDQEGAKHDNDKLTVEYVGYWNWDMATYLNYSKIEGFNQGQRVRQIEFSSGNLPSKFGNSEKRIQLMLDVMFGRKTVEEANAQL
tara:strand:+ start:254 stop:715 length:462 start_codon:yes stop_codon:yes gene_type:complete